MKWSYLLLLLLIACTNGAATHISTEQSAQVAELFIRNNPTYGSYGNDLQLIESAQIGCDNCIMHVFTFTRSYAGYGQSRGPEQKTSHTATVVVEGDQVVSAIIDQQWDELHGAPVK